MSSGSDPRAARQAGRRRGGTFEPLAEALARIAFGLPIDQPALKVRLEKEPADQVKLETAAMWLSEAGHKARVRLRGRYVTDFYSDEEAALANTTDIPSDSLRDFLQVDLDKGGLRRRPIDHNVVVGGHAEQAAYDRAFATWAAAGESIDRSKRLAEGYRDVQVSRDDLQRELRRSSSIGSRGRPLELDHDDIRARARQMRAEQPNLSIGSAAAAIGADLPNNPKTGRERDSRGLERIIAPVWEGGGDEIH